MAGAGYKLFATGDVLTAAQVNTYLNEQTVMVFADSAARTSALSGVLAEGMMSYLQDTNAVEVYNGTAWVGVSGAGDVTEVQAGTGISVASGTGPIPVVTNSMATEIDAKGDLVVGTGADTFARLAVGTDGHTLVADSSTATGLAYAAPAGGGKVLQVVYASTTTETTVASTSFTDTTLTATITPSAATSTVLAIVSQNLFMERNTTGVACGIKLFRDATNILDLGYPFNFNLAGITNFGGGALQSFSYVDSPSSTSALTYKTQIAVNTTANSGYVKAQTSSNASTIILMEIGA
jgi:hypothetical protein